MWSFLSFLLQLCLNLKLWGATSNPTSSFHNLANFRLLLRSSSSPRHFIQFCHSVLCWHRDPAHCGSTFARWWLVKSLSSSPLSSLLEAKNTAKHLWTRIVARRGHHQRGQRRSTDHPAAGSPDHFPLIGASTCLRHR